VKFDDFENNSPTLVTTTTNAVVLYALGAASGENKGCLGVYIHTSSGEGNCRHGTVGAASGGKSFLQSKPLNTGQWYHIQVEKSERSLKLTVDDTVYSCSIPNGEKPSEFNMRPLGEVIIGSREISRSPDYALHGKIENFEVISLNELSSIPLDRPEVVAASECSAWVPCKSLSLLEATDSSRLCGTSYSGISNTSASASTSGRSGGAMPYAYAMKALISPQRSIAGALRQSQGGSSSNLLAAANYSTATGRRYNNKGGTSETAVVQKNNRLVYVIVYFMGLVLGFQVSYFVFASNIS